MAELEIVQCRDPLRWYADMVGQRVPLLADLGSEYKSREPAGYINFVLRDDAVVVEPGGDTDPALICFSRLAGTLEAEALTLERDAAVRRHGAKDLRAALERLGGL